MVKRTILCLLWIVRQLVFTHNFPLSVLKDNDMRMGGTEGCWRSSTGISPPRLIHRTLPIACDAFNARTVAVREYLSFCASSPMSRRAHFPVLVLFAHSKRSWRTSRPARRRRDVSVCLILRRNYPPGFLCQKPCPRVWKGRTRPGGGFTQAVP